MYQPTARRLARTLGCLAFFRGIAPLLVLRPPALTPRLRLARRGGLSAHRAWTGRSRARAFAGICPRCERELSLSPGTGISLPTR